MQDFPTVQRTCPTHAKVRQSGLALDKHKQFQHTDESNGEKGQTLILVALCLVAICGFLGLAIDVGQLRAAEMKLQSTADAAAIAGALELDECAGASDCTEMQTAVQQALVENGLSGSTLTMQCASSSAGLVITLNNGPCALGSTDPNYNNTSYVEALVAEKLPMTFAGIFGLHSVTLSARSEAGLTNSSFCFYVAPDNNHTGSLILNSGGHLSANCGIIDDGALTTNSGSHESATAFDYNGTYTNNGGILSPSPTYHAPLPDPLSYLQPPSKPSGSCPQETLSGKGNVLSAGCYSGITINSGGDLTLNPGTYYLTGNFIPNSGTTVTGTGVTLYFTNGASFIGNSGSTVTFVAPTSGSYTGILFYQNPSDAAEFILDSGSKSTWQGAIYTPGATIDINSGGNAAAYTIVVANAAIIDSGAKFNIGNDYSSLHGKSPIKSGAVLMQ